MLLQSGGAVKKNHSLPEGSIIVQQRPTTKNTGSAVVNQDGPILLQTLKRLDKSQSILVFRNSGPSAANAAGATVSVTGGVTASSAAGRLKSMIVSATSVEEDGADKRDGKVVVAPTVTRSIHTPLGSGE